MAIEISFVTVIAPKEFISASFPGGEQAYFEFCHAPSFLEDEHLMAVSFMSTNDADRFISEVLDRGLEEMTEGHPSLVAITSRTDSSSLPQWLECGRVGKDYGAWYKGTEPGTVNRIPRSIGGRGFAVPLAEFRVALSTQGIHLMFLDRDSDSAEVRLETDDVQVEAYLGIKESPDEVSGLLTHIPKRRPFNYAGHDDLIERVARALQSVGAEIG